jgi:hypothetical protein
MFISIATDGKNKDPFDRRTCKEVEVAEAISLFLMIKS